MEQAIHTPPLALATMLHRSVALVHGVGDAWADPDESVLLFEALAERATNRHGASSPRAGHDLAEASDTVTDQIVADLAARIRPVELPPVLVAIEEMTDGVR